MKTVLEKLRKMKQDWEHEKRRLEGEREYLQNAANRLNQEMDQARQENDDTRGIQSELEQAKRAIADFEVQLQMERDRLRAITNERNRTVNEKNDILSNLERTHAVSVSFYCTFPYSPLARTWKPSKSSCKSASRKIMPSKQIFAVSGFIFDFVFHVS